MYNCNYPNMGMAIPNIAPEKKFNLTIEEACAYFNIGEHKMRHIVAENPRAKFVLRIGTKTLIKKTAFEDFVLQTNAL